MPESDSAKRQALAQVRTLHPAPDRVHAALFLQHPAFFDARDELQVKYEMLRAHFLDGRPVTTVCAAFGYSRQTFYLLRDRLAHGGLAGLRDARPGPVGPRTCTPAVVAFLHAQRADEPTLSIPTLVDRLERTHGVVCIGGPWSGSWAAVTKKKTPRGGKPSGEPAADACRCLDPGRFHVAGGPAQAEYERRRAAFLSWDNRAGAARPSGLGLAGLAGLLTRPAAEWTVHCVAARPSRWTGAVDTRMTALDEAYRLILGAAPSRGAPVTSQECKEEGHASRACTPACQPSARNSRARSRRNWMRSRAGRVSSITMSWMPTSAWTTDTVARVWTAGPSNRLRDGAEAGAFEALVCVRIASRASTPIRS